MGAAKPRITPVFERVIFPQELRRIRLTYVESFGTMCDEVERHRKL
jgi:hypothetical protein